MGANSKSNPQVKKCKQDNFTNHRYSHFVVVDDDHSCESDNLSYDSYSESDSLSYDSYSDSKDWDSENIFNLIHNKYELDSNTCTLSLVEIPRIIVYRAPQIILQILRRAIYLIFRSKSVIKMALLTILKNFKKIKTMIKKVSIL